MSQKRSIKVGNVIIGGGAPVSVQSMNNTDTRDVEATLRQIEELYVAGCQITRVAVLDEEAARAIYKLKESSPIPIVADIHFNYRLAVLAAEAGADKIRINPGNIGGEDRVKAVVDACRKRGIPIRIGVNGGSLDARALDESGGDKARAMVISAKEHIEYLHRQDFYDICVSVKDSSVKETIRAYELLDKELPYPLHVGITHAGGSEMAVVKSAAGIGAVLARGIGDTIRVSLTGAPVEEVRLGRMILNALELRRDMPELISCPTCGRCRVDLETMTSQVAKRLEGIKKPLKIAVMGCEVNGPGEAREADAGIACGAGFGLVFKKGEIVNKLKKEELVDGLFRIIDEIN